MAEDQSEKRRAACDECRTRKLKCSGELPRCSRCQREGIQCVYSPQKQMGRPRKRRREEGSTMSEQQSDNSNEPSSSTPATTISNGVELVQQPDSSNSVRFVEFPARHDDVTDFLPAAHSHYYPIADLYVSPDDTQQYSLDPNLAIDPTQWHLHPPAPSIPTGPSLPPLPCSCLSAMYLTLTELQTMSTFAFPASIPTQRKAMATASSMIHCDQCPIGMFSLIQNTQSLSSLLAAIAERFHRILEQIDVDAEELERTGGKKPFRVGDNDPTLLHLHTGTLDCPMGFSLELEAKDWKTLAKKAVKSEVLGGGSNTLPFVRLLDLYEERQNEWHRSGKHIEERERVFGVEGSCREEDAHCVKMINHIRRMVGNMQWE